MIRLGFHKIREKTPSQRFGPSAPSDRSCHRVASLNPPYSRAIKDLIPETEASWLIGKEMPDHVIQYLPKVRGFLVRSHQQYVHRCKRTHSAEKNPTRRTENGETNTWSYYR